MKRMFGLLMMVGFLVSVGCGGDDDSSPTSSSVSQDKYSETIVGTWKDGGEPIWTFKADRTVVYDGSEEHIYTWSIDGSTLTVFNPVKSDQDLLVGTWLDEDGDPITLRSNGTFVDWDGDEGTWSLVGDQLTLTYDDPDFAEFDFTATLNSVTDIKLTVTDEDGERVVLTQDGDDDDEDGEVFARYKIISLSNTEFVFVDPEYPDIKTTLTR